MPLGPYTLDDSTEIELEDSTNTEPKPSRVSIDSPSNVHTANLRKRRFVTTKADDVQPDVEPRIKKRAPIYHDDVDGDDNDNNRAQTETQTNSNSRRSQIRKVPEVQRQVPEDVLAGDRSSRLDDTLVDHEDASRSFLEVYDSTFLKANDCVNIDLKAYDRVSTVKIPIDNSNTKFKAKLTLIKPKPTRSLNPTSHRTLTLKPTHALAGEAPLSRTRMDSAHFWRRTREAYDGSGALLLKMDEVPGGGVSAKIFTPGESCYGEKFGCVFLR
ncbi:hypothetical protein C0991_000300 [Blastosporella zonata]|nr:hypothetical protein C0991_000300 [Blastosporella zonata]